MSPHNTTATFTITPDYNFIYATTNAGQTLDGTAANDWVYGGAGNDTIATGAAADRVYAGSGDDIVRGGAGADILYAEGGNDTADYSDATGAVFVDIAARFANETALTVGTVSGVTAVESKDTLIGFENVIGSAFGDRLYGTTGDNVFHTGAGSDIVYGLAGNDTISYVAAAGAVFVDLQARFATETALTSGTVNGGTVAVSTDTLISLENARGSAFGDRLYGTSDSNQLFGEDGDDFIYGLGGADTITGGTGGDRLVGGDGIDTLTGGEGADRFFFVGIEVGGPDVITDFESGIDDIYLSLANFDGAATFFAGTGTTDAIFGMHTAAGLAYDTANNVLYYDADGSGAASAIALASFTEPVGGIASSDVEFY
ncbi:MAG: calcium-binding protein [Verrucomicrobiae bacterium]|nr:calcium-binding protein [Verrucomicrobiae bacterium]